MAKSTRKQLSRDYHETIEGRIRRDPDFAVGIYRNQRAELEELLSEIDGLKPVAAKRVQGEGCGVMSEQRCGTCRWFILEDQQPTWGECHHRLPQWVREQDPANPLPLLGSVQPTDGEVCGCWEQQP